MMPKDNAAQFSPKDPGEVLPLVFDFAAFGSSFTSPVVTVTRRSGVTDGSPSAMLIGSPVVTSNLVTQNIGGGVDGTDYVIRCQVSSGANIYVISGTLPVRLAVGEYSQAEIID